MPGLTELILIAATVPVLALVPILLLRKSAQRAGLSTWMVSVTLVLQSPVYLARSAWRWHFVRRFFFCLSCVLGVGLAIVKHIVMPFEAWMQTWQMVLAASFNWALLVSPTVIGAYLLGRSMKLANRVCAARGRVCPRCTYDLSNNAPSETMVCSECGYAAPIEEIVRGWKSLAYLPGACEVPGVERGTSASQGAG